MKSVVLTSVGTDEALLASYETGAISAFLSKEGDLEKLVEAIKAVSEGENKLDAFSAKEAEYRLKNAEVELDFLALSDRDRIIIEMVADGESDQEIAEELEVSHSTVRNSLTKIYKEHGIESRSRLSAIVWENRSKRA